MNFLTFLEKYENENVSDVKGLVESKTKIETTIINEAFNTEYPSKKEAIFNLEKVFCLENKAPESIDVAYLKENLESLKQKVENLSEGDIRIIIHNHEAGKDAKAGGGKRGRPPKDSLIDLDTEDDMEESKKEFMKAPKKISKVYDKPESTVVSEEEDEDPVEEDAVIPSKEEQEEQEDGNEVEAIKVKREGIGISLDDASDMIEKSVAKDKLIEELDKLKLSEEELKRATFVAENDSEIDESIDITERISKASGIIKKLSSYK